MASGIRRNPRDIRLVYVQLEIFTFSCGDAVKLNEVAPVSCQPVLKVLEQIVGGIDAYP
jgi:hypothetical protein